MKRWIVASSDHLWRKKVAKFPTTQVQTAHHKCTEDDEMDCKLFMDFDMAVLGRPWQQYEVYSDLTAQGALNAAALCLSCTSI